MKQLKKTQKQKQLEKNRRLKKFFDFFLTKPKIKPETIRQVCKLLIFIFIFFVIIEIIFLIPGINNFFSSLITTQKNKIIMYIVITFICFIQILPIFNLPMLPILFVFYSLGWFVTNQKPSSFIENIQLIFSLDGLFLILAIMFGYMFGIFVTYLLGRVLGIKAYQFVNDGKIDGFAEWSKKINGKYGKFAYFLTVLLPIFPDDLIIIVVGAAQMEQKFVILVNLIGRFIGLLAIMIFIPFISLNDTSIPYSLIVYTLLLLISLIIYFIVNQYLNKHKDKKTKILLCFKSVLKKIKKETDITEEIIQDIIYSIDGTYRTTIDTKYRIMIFVKITRMTDASSYNRENRIVICGKFSKYWEIIFDKTYSLIEKISTFENDILNEIRLYQ